MRMIKVLGGFAVVLMLILQSASAQNMQVMPMRTPCVKPDIPTGFRIVTTVAPGASCEENGDLKRSVEHLGADRRGGGRNSATHLQFIDLRLGVAWRSLGATTWVPIPQWQHDVIAEIDPAVGNTLCAQPEPDGSIKEWILDGEGRDCEHEPMPRYYRLYLGSGDVCVEPSNYCVAIADPMPAEGQRRARSSIDGVKARLTHN